MVRTIRTRSTLSPPMTHHLFVDNISTLLPPVGMGGNCA